MKVLTIFNLSVLLLVNANSGLLKTMVSLNFQQSTAR